MELTEQLKTQDPNNAETFREKTKRRSSFGRGRRSNVHIVPGSAAGQTELRNCSAEERFQVVVHRAFKMTLDEMAFEITGEKEFEIDDLANVLKRVQDDCAQICSSHPIKEEQMITDCEEYIKKLVNEGNEWELLQEQSANESNLQMIMPEIQFSSKQQAFLDQRPNYSQLMVNLGDYRKKMRTKIEYAGKAIRGLQNAYDKVETEWKREAKRLRDQFQAKENDEPTDFKQLIRKFNTYEDDPLIKRHKPSNT